MNDTARLIILTMGLESFEGAGSFNPQKTIQMLQNSQTSTPNQKVKPQTNSNSKKKPRAL